MKQEECKKQERMKTRNNYQGLRNHEQGTGNKKQGTWNKEQEIGNKKQKEETRNPFHLSPRI